MKDGHGWVVPRADGHRARCGGPSICPLCQRERVMEETRDTIDMHCPDTPILTTGATRWCPRCGSLKLGIKGATWLPATGDTEDVRLSHWYQNGMQRARDHLHRAGMFHAVSELDTLLGEVCDGQEPWKKALT